MASSTSQIIIVGAGIAGLTLGRCLRERGIAALILERYRFDRTQYHDRYGITLHPWAYRPLLNVLKMDESTFRGKLSIDAPLEELNTTVPENSPSGYGVETSPGGFRCHRKVLEAVLREHLNVKFESDVGHIAIDPQNISLHLKDNRLLLGHVIAADGVHSRIRNTLIPRMETKVLPYVVFYGRRTLLFDEYKRTLAPQMQAENMIELLHGNVLLRISILQHSRINKSTLTEVVVSYTYSRPACENDQLYNPNRPLDKAQEIPAQLYSELEELRDLPSGFKEIFDPSKVRKDSLLNWLMRSSLVDLEDIRSLADHNVLLLGDAVHTMPILGGEGANFAMKDSFDLAEHIALHGLEGTKTFFDDRYNMWKDAVENSERRLVQMHTLAKDSYCNSRDTGAP